MVDIIVIDRGDFLEKTLLSIFMQTIVNQVNVILVSSIHYPFLSSFQDKLSFQLVPTIDESLGKRREKGFSEAKHKYVLFMDGGDVFYDVFSLANMYYKIGSNDAIIGGIYNDEKPYLNFYFVGNLYKRSYLVKHHIFFCDNDGEGNEFQQLFIMSGGVYQYCNDYVYYRNRDIHWEFFYLHILQDTISSIEIASKRHYPKEKIAFVLYDVILFFAYRFHDCSVLYFSDELKELLCSLISLYHLYEVYVDYEMQKFLSEVHYTNCEIDQVYVCHFLDM